MKRYEILEHKADLKIRASGRTKEEVFLNMLLGMNKSMEPKIMAKEKSKREIKIKALDLPTLLVDFLSEILYLTQANKEIYNNVKFEKFTDTALEAEISGQKVGRFGEDIKAVTYHGLDVRQKKNKSWEAVVLFDI